MKRATAGSPERSTPVPRCGLRPLAKSRAALVGTLLLIAVSSGETYKFYARNSLDIAASPQAGVRRWSGDDFPLRFRVLENDNLPNFEGLNHDRWHEIVVRALGAWGDVPTADIRVLLENEPVRSAFSNADDGINTVGFTSNPRFDGAWFVGSALHRTEAGRLVGCDIELNPAFFDVLDQRAADNPQREMERLDWLEGVVLHEFGHCLGLAHTDLNPVWHAWSGEPVPVPAGFWPAGVSALEPNPVMSYGGWYGAVRLSPDDETGISLLYPTPTFSASRGSVGGRVVFENGRGVSFAYVQVVEGSSPEARFGPGVFTDTTGGFVLQGLQPGPHLFWVHPVGDLRAHVGESRLGDADLLETLDIRDQWFWAVVAAGGFTMVPEITISAGRTGG